MPEKQPFAAQQIVEKNPPGHHVATGSNYRPGDTVLVKRGRKVSQWTIIQVEEKGFRAKNFATNKTRKFASNSGHIIVPPDVEIPGSLRKQLPRDIGVCRATEHRRYKLYSKTELEVIDIQQESISVIPFEFAIEGGEPAWKTNGGDHVDARNIFFARNPVKLPGHLTSEIEVQISEMF